MTLRRIFYDSLGVRIGWILAIAFVSLLALVGAFLFVGHEVEEHNCAMAGDQYHRNTVFDDWSFNCYVQTTDGRRVKLNTYITTHEER